MRDLNVSYGSVQILFDVSIEVDRGEVVALLGRPNGEAIYPLIRSRTETGIVYSYSHAKGSVFNMKFYSKALIVSFDANGVVSDVDYTVSGEK